MKKNAFLMSPACDVPIWLEIVIFFKRFTAVTFFLSNVFSHDYVSDENGKHCLNCRKNDKRSKFFVRTIWPLSNDNNGPNDGLIFVLWYLTNLCGFLKNVKMENLLNLQILPINIWMREPSLHFCLPIQFYHSLCHIALMSCDMSNDVVLFDDACPVILKSASN